MAIVVPPQDTLAEGVEHFVTGIRIVAFPSPGPSVEGVSDVAASHILATMGTGNLYHVHGLLHKDTIVLVIGDKHHLVLP